MQAAVAEYSIHDRAVISVVLAGLLLMAAIQQWALDCWLRLLTCAGSPRQAQGPGLSGLDCGWQVVRARGWWCGLCARGRPALLRSATLGLAPGPAT